MDIPNHPEALDIAEVARRTGLTSRALRFYEARGLVQPLRSASGRRYYGPGELERIHQILALKRAGLTIAQIERIGRGREIDLGELVAAQIRILDRQALELKEAKALLVSIQSRIKRSEPIDVATFCSLIRNGEMTMTKQKEAWQQVRDRYYDDAAKADFDRQMPLVDADFNQEEYAAQWKELAGRIRAAMPMDPAGEQALGFVREWFALLAPFTRVATPAMWNGVVTMYDHMDEWQGGDADPGFDAEIFRFIREAGTAARAAGHDIGPMPEWFK